MQLWELLAEQFSPLNEAKSPAEQAHEMGLVHVGWGYWAKEGDDTGTPVAKTVNGQLVQLGHDDIDAAKKDFNNHEEDASYSGEIDLHAVELGDLGAEALTHMTEQALEHTGITSQASAVRNAIALSILKGEPADVNAAAFAHLDPDQKEALAEYLSYAATGKSKLARAVAIAEKMRILKERIAEKKAEEQLAAYQEQQAQAAMHAKQQAAAQAAMTPEPDFQQAPGDQLTPENVAKLLGLKQNIALNPEFEGLIQKLDKAKSGAAVNYIAQLLQGKHSQVKTPAFISKEQWKQLHKHLKDLKGPIKVGAANPGLKKGGVQPVTPDPDAAQKYKAWLDALPEGERNTLGIIWYEFLGKSGIKNISDIGGQIGQGELLMAVYGAVKNNQWDAVKNLVNQNLSQDQVDTLIDAINKSFVKKPDETAPEQPNMQWWDDLSVAVQNEINDVYATAFHENAEELTPSETNFVCQAIYAALQTGQTDPIWNLADKGISDGDIIKLRDAALKLITAAQDEESQSVDDEKENWLPVSYDMWTEPTKDFVNLAWSELQAEYWEKYGKDIELTDAQKGDFYAKMAQAFDMPYMGLVGKLFGDLENEGILPTGDGVAQKLMDFTMNKKADAKNAEEYNNIVAQNSEVQNAMSFPGAENMKSSHRVGLAANIAKALQTGDTFGLDNTVSNMHALGILSDDDVEHIKHNVSHVLATKDAQPSIADDDSAFDTEQNQEASSEIISATGLENVLSNQQWKDVSKILKKALHDGDQDALETFLHQMNHDGEISMAMLGNVLNKYSDKYDVLHNKIQVPYGDGDGELPFGDDNEISPETEAHAKTALDIMIDTGLENYMSTITQKHMDGAIQQALATGDTSAVIKKLDQMRAMGDISDGMAVLVFNSVNKAIKDQAVQEPEDDPAWLNLNQPIVANPLANAIIPPGAISGVQKSLNGWAKGDAKKILPWIIKKVKEDPKKTVNLKWQAMELVKSYGIPLSEVPDDVVPYEMKDTVKKAKESPVATEPAYDAVGQAENLLDAYGGDMNDAIQGVGSSILNAVSKGDKDAVKKLSAVMDILKQKQSATPQAAPEAELDDIKQTADWFTSTYTDPNEADDMAKASLKLSQQSGDQAGVSKMKRVILQMAKNKITKDQVSKKDIDTMADVIIQQFGADAAMQQCEGGLISALDKGEVGNVANMMALKSVLLKKASEMEPSFEEPFDAIDTQPAEDDNFEAQSLKFAETLIGDENDWDAAKDYAKNALMASEKAGNAFETKKWKGILSALDTLHTDMHGHPPEEEDPTASTETADANSIVQSALSDMGKPFDKLSKEHQELIMKAAEKAMKSPTEFGAVAAFLPLKGKVDTDIIDAIKDNVLAELDKQGTLDKTPGAFKNYFDYDDMFDKMEKGEFSSKGGMDQSSAVQKQKFQDFLKNLSPADRQKLTDAAKKGLSFTGVDGGKQAQQYYKDNLVGKMPGFDDDVYAVWRRALRGFHDELKDAETFEFQKKTEAEKKKVEAEMQKKAAEELQKTLAAISSGDSAQAIKSIATSVGIDKLNPDQQKKMLIAMHGALNAPTSQAAFDKLNAVLGDNAYSGIFSGGQPTHYGASAQVPLPQDKKDTLRQLIATVWAEKSDPYQPAHEPVDKTPVETRVQHVLQQWKNDYGTSVSAVSNKNAGKVQSKTTERDFIHTALKNALAEPDPSKVNSHLNSLLLTQTSLSDEAVAQLRQLVQQERQAPAALQGKKLEKPGITSTAGTPQKYDGPKAALAASGGSGITNVPVYKAKEQYYKFPAHKKKEIHDDIFQAVTGGFNTTSTKSKAAFVDTLQNKLEKHGMESKLARNTALWVAREFSEDGPLKKAAVKKVGNVKPSDFQIHHIPLPTPAEDAAARQTIAALPASAKEVKTEYVAGEHVKVHSHGFEWNDQYGAGYHNAEADSDAKEQDKWRKANLSPEDLQKFTEAANDWQGSGQWTNPNLQRKAVNDVFTRTIDGPPPMFAEVNKPLERGLSMSYEDFDDFIKVFNVGKKTYFGPSGFSANRSTASSFLGGKSVQVMIRVRPPKSGKVKGARLHNRSGHMHHGNEQEIVLGTNNNFRTVAVTKHVSVGYGGGCSMAYEIEMQYDEDDINEAIKPNAVGLDTSHWKGYSRNSVKMLLKWMNTSLERIPK